jgi:hypothetical protein
LTPIRPSPFPVQPAPSSAADAARLAAQRAFFAAAMGKGGAPAAAQAPEFSAAPVVARPANVRPDPAAEAPAKLLRPGSLLDIRV